MVDAVFLAPIVHSFRNEFAIVSDEDAECFAGLHGDSFMPVLDGVTGICFRSKGDTPNVAGEIVN